MNISRFSSITNYMMQRTILVIFVLQLISNYHSCLASVRVAQQEPEHQHIDQLTQFEQLQMPKDQTPLVRLPSNTLLKYTAYKDVSILHFRIPTDTRTALFTFKAYEESKSAFQRVCQPRDVTLHLKAGSYPVISPENITFPRHFLSADQRFEIYNLQFKSDGRTQRLTVDGPQSGNWFAVAFISWTDPNNERIEQQGLAASCETLLLSEMSVARALPIILNNEQIHTNTLTSDQNGTKEISYKFYVPRNVASITARIAFGNICLTCPQIGFYVQANALPNKNNYIHNTIINPNQTTEVILIEFYVQSGIWHFIDIKFETNNSKNNILDKIHLDEHILDENITFYEIDFTIQIDYHIEDDTETNEPDKSIIFRDIEYYPLLRQTYREFFMFDYDLIPDQNGSIPTYLNLTIGQTIGFRFDVGDVYDIGGTLSFAIAMKQDIKGNDVDTTSSLSSSTISTSTAINSIQDSILTEKLIDKTMSNNNNDNNNNSNNERSNQTIIICMRLGEPGKPEWPDKCRYGNKLLQASSIVNNTNIDTSTGLIHVPFPESGQWFITMGLFCQNSETPTTARITIIDSVKDFIKKYSKYLDLMKPPCSCGVGEVNRHYKQCIDDQKCLMRMNETETLKIKECLMDSKCVQNSLDMTKRFELHHKYATEQSVQQDLINPQCNSSIVFTISSSPCVAGRCGRYGRCYHYMSGGFVFSTCLCIKGYRGWDCTEDSQVPTSFSILIASLLLTLSNLLFIPSIYFAIRRKYYTESVIYFFAMFFSTFYHACDSGEDEYSFCLVKIGVLQFCDFYCGLLAIWVTLIAMAHIRQQFISLLHMFGAIVLAFGTELNKQSLWVFLAPSLTGICLITSSWSIKCRKTHKWFPSRKYLTIYMPLGTVLVMIGLVCYAFLQTKQNYHIVHSIWHMVMALSILCLLPNRNSFLPKC